MLFASILWKNPLLFSKIVPTSREKDRPVFPIKVHQNKTQRRTTAKKSRHFTPLPSSIFTALPFWGCCSWPTIAANFWWQPISCAQPFACPDNVCPLWPYCSAQYSQTGPKSPIHSLCLGQNTGWSRVLELEDAKRFEPMEFSSLQPSSKSKFSKAP